MPKSNAELFEDYVRMNYTKPDSAPSFEKAQLFMYRFKLLDVCWFDGEFPTSPTEIFDYCMNEDWPTPEALPENLEGIYTLNTKELRFLCSQLEKPTWTDFPYTKYFRWTYADILEDWNHWKL